MSSNRVILVRPDNEDILLRSPPKTPSSSKNSICFKSTATSKSSVTRQPLHECNSLGRPKKAAILKKDADYESDSPTHVAKYFARTEGISPLKALNSSNTPGSSGSMLIHRNATLSNIHVSSPKRVRLRKYRTEPVILALRDELRKTTGITPHTPEKHENPFEPADLPGAMSRAWLSPDTFKSEPETSPSFKWSIDHMATLHPVDIDHSDILRTEYLKHVQTESDEDDAQENIRKFFDEKDVHLPSPVSHHHNSPQWDSTSPTRLTDAARESTRARLALAETREVECQTTIHMSPGFDFEKVFADYQCSRMLRRSSSDSVRRRLFACDMDSPASLGRSLSCSDANDSTGFIFAPEACSSAMKDYVETDEENSP